MSQTDDGDVENFQFPGSENTNWVEVEDRSGDAYYDEKEEMPQGGLVIIIFLVGATVAVLLFVILYMVKNRKEQQKKLAAEEGGSSRNGNALASGGSRNFTTSQQTSGSTPFASTDPEKRRKEIENSLEVKVWGTDIFPEAVEVNEDGDEEAGSNNQNSCPIDRKPFQQGDEVVYLSCGHRFRKTNILNWLQYQERCPVCNVGTWRN